LYWLRRSKLENYVTKLEYHLWLLKYDEFE
jgi:hypothetical protein